MNLLQLSVECVDGSTKISFELFSFQVPIDLIFLVSLVITPSPL